MSPSEFDLRAALHDGEGDARLDVDGVVTGARGRLAQRRMRVLSAAAAVVVVAGAGVAAASIWGGSSARQHGGPALAASGSASGSASGPAAGTALRNPAAASGPSGAAGAGAADVCPKTYPQVLLPGGGSPGRFGSGGAMFAEPVATLFVCGYGSGFTPGAVVPAVRVYTGSSAATLAASIEKAATAPPALRCPDIVLASQNRLVLVALAADGTRERDVTTTLTVPTCGVRVTNGTAIRYDWQPPGGYEAQLLALRPATAAPSGATGPGGVPGSGSVVAPAPAGSPGSTPHKSLLPVGPGQPVDGSPAR